MLRRFAALMFALAVLAAPVATQLCEATCTLHRALTPSAAATQPPCHEEPVSGSAELSEAPHVCGHADGLPSSVEQAMRAVSPSAIVPAAVFAAPQLVFTPLAVSTIQHGPPGSLTFSTQLRV